MHRRNFLKSAALVASAPYLTVLPGVTTSAGESPTAWKLGWRSVDVDSFAPLPLSIDGEIPADVVGTLYRNGPAKLERAGVRYKHWFDGDGMIQQFRITPDSIVHQGKFVATTKYVEEEAAGQFLYSGAGTELPATQGWRNNDSGNVANTALLPFDGELLALWEGGSAYRVDADTLQTLGRKDWSDELKHMPFSAHPLVDTEGTVWNVGSATYSGGSGAIVVYRIDTAGEVVATELIKTPFAGYMHSFTMSERHLIFYIGPHVFERGGSTFVNSFQWQPDRGSRLLVVEKDDLSSQRWFEAPSGFVFHCANAYEQRGRIIANMSLYEDAGIMDTAMFGLLDTSADAPTEYPQFPRAELATVELDLTSGKVHVQSSGELLEFPGSDARLGYRAKAIFGTGHAPSERPTYSNAVVRIDPTTGKVNRAIFPDEHIVEEPLFVGGSSGNDWLVGTFLDLGREQTGVYVLDANNLAGGPVAMARMERALPLGFHGCFTG
ncbi:MAG: carotenoid oxygenase family protein [Pseudomonadota bacterium]